LLSALLLPASSPLFAQSNQPLTAQQQELLNQLCNTYAMACEVAKDERWPSEQMRKEAHEHADILWSKILIGCGKSYVYAGSGLDPTAVQGSDRRFGGSDEEVTEYQNVAFKIIRPAPLSLAQMANARTPGVEDEGSAVMLATIYRHGHTANHSWDKFVDGPLSPMSPITAMNPEVLAHKVLDPFSTSLGATGMSGVLRVHMEKRDGTWFYRFDGPLSDTSRSEDSLMRSAVFIVNNYSLSKGAQIECSTEGEVLFSGTSKADERNAERREGTGPIETLEPVS
jgi:hypothetical protein